MSIKVNKKAPNFLLLDQNNNKIDLYKLKSNLVLFFYPKDNTPGCTSESLEFTKLHNEFLKLGVQVVGVSRDSIKSHLK